MRNHFQPQNNVDHAAGRQPKVYTVTELTRLIRMALERQFGEVWLEGEISNLRQPASGHYYFTLKDESAQINAVLFRGDQQGLKFQLRDGLMVRAIGEISVYERGGQYQIIVRRVEEAGQGGLQAKFEALKRKLQQEGLFAQERKRPLPMVPLRLGIVTSPSGAAIRDMLKILFSREAKLQVLVAPTRVQGEGAAEEIAAALDLLNTLGGVDLVILGRGGGSLEDLWCFNEEVVARAIARSRVPVISAVGHEIDYTISDFVADVRAPTPTAAAELVLARKEAFEEALAEHGQRLGRALREAMLEARNRLLRLARRHAVQAPARLIRQHVQRLENWRQRMRHAISAQVRNSQQRLDDAALKMLHASRMRLQFTAHRLGHLEGQLSALNPLNVLRRGYSVTSDAEGHIIRSIKSMRLGQRLLTRLSDGMVESEARQLQPDDQQRVQPAIDPKFLV